MKKIDDDKVNTGERPSRLGEYNEDKHAPVSQKDSESLQIQQRKTKKKIFK